jgi:hypothetical protein
MVTKQLLLLLIKKVELQYNLVRGGEEMTDDRFERIENMLVQLIQSVGQMHSKQDAMETKNEERHEDLTKQLKQLELDQDFIWEKAVRAEREIEKLKKRLRNAWIINKDLQSNCSFIPYLLPQEKILL